ncbi:hypothetical protein VTL71DRAFT_845 [Oculimacula yallundae]|uniref:Uncharacterized protein n=1 Tax=Oculimacula yallundae TaxID=86028 RepID=A0ABR4D255_9HELO
MALEPTSTEHKISCLYIHGKVIRPWGLTTQKYLQQYSYTPKEKKAILDMISDHQFIQWALPKGRDLQAFQINTSPIGGRDSLCRALGWNAQELALEYAPAKPVAEIVLPRLFDTILARWNNAQKDLWPVQEPVLPFPARLVVELHHYLYGEVRPEAVATESSENVPLRVYIKQKIQVYFCYICLVGFGIFSIAYASASYSLLQTVFWLVIEISKLVLFVIQLFIFVFAKLILYAWQPQSSNPPYAISISSTGSFSFPSPATPSSGSFVTTMSDALPRSLAAAAAIETPRSEQEIASLAVSAVHPILDATHTPVLEVLDVKEPTQGGGRNWFIWLLQLGLELAFYALAAYGLVNLALHAVGKLGFSCSIDIPDTNGFNQHAVFVERGSAA